MKEFFTKFFSKQDPPGMYAAIHQMINEKKDIIVADPSILYDISQRVKILEDRIFSIERKSSEIDSELLRLKNSIRKLESIIEKF